MYRKCLLMIAIATMLIGVEGWAQNKNTQKILGCWKLKGIMSMEMEGDTSSLPYINKNAVTCYSKKGTFSVQLTEDKRDKGSGKYYFSKDGKLLYQDLDSGNRRMAEEYEEILLDAKNMELRLGNLIYAFYKV